MKVNIGDGNREGWLETEDAAGKISVLEEITGPIQAEANGTEPEYINYVPQFQIRTHHLTSEMLPITILLHERN
ncbi:hypothetical protein N7481_006970 [Penicillium waksmanii]|uniref:uncharacterized protein n=1 Tax=Penicillium waksmanii TaxID=69791 RepID=UPI002548DE31|nr:uncharacterized protein N7481_006970 [Penicillium waksmanii]KAJ5979672.1 hypothetical protein N7481_006970 [Penicillium waksmanii]